MKFYTYRQNNSGGHNVGKYKYIIVEAPSAAEADEIAINHKVYFDGVENGVDCSCCGDRWYRASEPGTDKPSIYGDEVALVIGTYDKYLYKVVR